MKPTVRDYYGRILVVVLLLVAMYFVARLERYYLLFIINILYFASIVLAWNIIGGYAGQLDLASAAYMATGGIVTALLIDNLNIPPLIAVFGGGLTSAVLAGAIGFPMFRFGVKEVWYALSTAALVVILNNAIRLLIGPFEYYLAARPIKTYDELYLYTSIALLLVLVFNNVISRSKLGFYLRAIREDELAAEAIGIDTRKYKLLALLVYAFIVGSLGYLYIALIGYFYTYRFYDTSISVSIAILGIIGGLGSVEGALVSAVILRGVGEYLRAHFAYIIPGLHLLLYGIVLLVIGIFEPEGIAGLSRRIYSVLRGARS
ncbi:MAG: branched-chain amino acid ABC transporter permease [Desulfurococcaceae archaeon]